METESQPHRVQHDVCAFMSQRGHLLLSLASEGDVGMVFDMVNLAYKVEDGDSGVAFKKTDRFLSHEEVRPSIDERRVFLAAAASSPHVTLGCIVWSVSATDDGAESLYFGPLAVAPEAQGGGVGGFLVSAVERLAAALRASSAPTLRSVSMCTVNHRTDIIPWYVKKGYVKVCEKAFPEPERLTRESHMIYYEKTIAGVE